MRNPSLAEHSREALFLWVQRLLAQPPWQGRRDLKLGDIFDDVPLLVETLDAVFFYGSTDELFKRHAAVLEKIYRHAQIRREQGVSLQDLLREYGLLRDALWDMLTRYLPPEQPTVEMRQLIAVVDGALDRIIQETVPAYLKSEEEQAA